MVEIVEIEQGSLNWHQFRKEGIGSSDAPVVMGVSPWKTPYQLWEEKTSEPKEEERQTNWAQQRGHELEPLARANFELDRNLDMPPRLVIHPEYSFLRASLDGYNVEENKVLEIKCPGAVDHALALKGEVPAKYFPQLQHQLLVTGARVAIYYSFDGVRGVALEVDRDESYLEELLFRCKDFWRLVTTKTPPPFSERDYVNETDFSNLANMAEWKRKQRQIKLLEADCEELRNEIVSRLKHPRVRGNGVKIQKISRKGSIDYSKIPELKNLNLEEFRKEPSEFFQFSIDKQ